MTNPLKGQVEVQLGSETYKARLTIDAIVQIEEKVGCGIIKLAQKMSEADIRMFDIISVLTPALRGGGNDITEKDVKKIITNVGIVEATTAVANLIAASLSDSGEETEGKPVEEE